MRVAISGCVHGELNKLYERIKQLDKKENLQTKLLIVNGDFQSIRNQEDLESMACPQKYKKLGDFKDYYNRSKKAYCLTIFVGGNHEASSFLSHLFYGGWVAPNIFYMGIFNVVKFAGLRIGGISGIFKQHDYNKGYFEKIPLDESSKRSIYHVRQFAIKMFQFVTPNTIDIMLSHDWPCGIHQFGNEKMLLKKKPFFKDDIKNNCLGNKFTMELLTKLQPKYWFSAHLHVYFEACVNHKLKNPDEINLENTNNEFSC